MSDGMGGRTQSRLDDNQRAIEKRMAGKGGVGEEAKSGEQMDQGGGEPKRVIFTEVYSRIVGYLRPVKAWNIGKQQEFEDRLPYDTPSNMRTNHGEDQA